jgi:hypothetical protein
VQAFTFFMLVDLKRNWIALAGFSEALGCNQLYLFLRKHKAIRYQACSKRSLPPQCSFPEIGARRAQKYTYPKSKEQAGSDI